MTPNQITASAQAVIQIANTLKAVYVRAKEFSDYNGVTDPGWNSLSDSSIIDTNGLIIGTQATPADISNAIGSINVFLAYWQGQAVSTSAWGQNIQKISNPIV